MQGQKVEGKEALREAHKMYGIYGGFCALISRPTELRIHDDIERGDNDSVKKPRGGTAKVGKACS